MELMKTGKRPDCCLWFDTTKRWDGLKWKPSKWSFTLANGSGTSFYDIVAPKWFHRLMQRFFLGIKWEVVEFEEPDEPESIQPTLANPPYGTEPFPDDPDAIWTKGAEIKICQAVDSPHPAADLAW